MSTSKWTTTGPLAGAHRVLDQRGRLLEADPGLGEEPPSGVAGLPRVAAHDGKPRRLQQRRRAVQAGQFSRPVAKHVRHAHRVEDS